MQLFQITKNIKRPSNNESCHYQQIRRGIIREKDQLEMELYSIQTLLEFIEFNNFKEHINITKKAAEKQVNKLVKSNLNLYQKKLIADNNIANNGRVLLGLTQKDINKETYVNYANSNELD